MNGLTNEEVQKSIEQYGKNEIEKIKTKKFINIFVDNLGDPIIRILLIALAVKVIFLIKEIENWINNYQRAMFDYKCSNMLLLNH